MKRLELIFNVIAIIVDAAMVVLAGTTAYVLRFRAEALFEDYPIIFEMAYPEFFRNIAFALPFTFVIFALFGLYNLRGTVRYWNVFAKIAAGVSVSLMIFVAVYFFDQTIFPSRLIALLSWLFAIISVGLGRFILLSIQRSFLRRGIGLHKTILIAEPGGENWGLGKKIERHPELGYKLIKIVEGTGSVLEEIKSLQATEHLDEIIFASIRAPKEIKESLVRFAHDHNISFTYVPDIVEAQRVNLAVADLAGIPVLELKNTPLAGWGHIVKRMTDIVVGGIATIIASPFLMVISIAVRLDSPGRVLFVQERYGQGKPFRFYKFRTMHQNMSEGADYGGQEAKKIRAELWKQNARGAGPFLKIKNDPRVTKVGRFLRSTKLDELPQLLNVMKGDMSLVGPRAHILEEVEKYREEYKRQFTVKPGVTGLGQITQLAVPDLPFEEEIRLNTLYIENWSLLLDLQILAKTALRLVFRPKQENDY